MNTPYETNKLHCLPLREQPAYRVAQIQPLAISRNFWRL